MQLPLFSPQGEGPLAVSYGMGVDSTAMLVGLAARSIRPDVILFADTGGEKKQTYAYEEVIQSFLQRVGFPRLVTVKYRASNFENRPPYYTLEQNMLTNGTLPAISFGGHNCSLKWKVAPQEEFLEGTSPRSKKPAEFRQPGFRPALEAWANGLKVRKMIGYDASPRDLRRWSHSGKVVSEFEKQRYEFCHPLIAWDWDREECVRQIQKAGLPVPPKSSCFFCAAMKPWEVAELEPAMLRRIIRMEARAHPRLRNADGLWRKPVKGMRGATPRPGSMTEFIRQKKLLPEDDIQQIWENTISQIITYQEGYAAALANGTHEEFLSSHAREDYRGEVLLAA